MGVPNVEYREWQPSQALRPYVRCLWVHRVGGGAPHHHRVLPDGCMDLMWQPPLGLHVAGPDTTVAPVTLPEGTDVVGIRFRPGVAPAVLGVPASELLDERTGLGQLWGDGATRRVVDEMGEHPAEVLERVVLERLRRGAGPDQLVAALVAAVESGGSRSVDWTVRERQLRRRCVAALGYGPKRFERIVRLQRFLSLLDRRRGLGLAELAAAAGYADQAHLTRECRSLASVTPGALAS